MKIIVHNDQIHIENIDTSVEKQLREQLTFTDKAKQYELRRLSKNPWSRTTPYYAALKEQVSKCLLQKVGEDIYLQTGLLSMLNGLSISEDRRVDTGSVTSLPWQDKPSQLRPYQEEAVQLALSSYRGLINLATGLGKTRVALSIVREIGRKTLIVVPSESIAKQFTKILSKCFGQDKVGYYGGGKKKIRSITVGIAASVHNDVEIFSKENLGLIIVDEVHHISADTFYSIATKLSSVGRIYGLTATDYRSDGKDLMIKAGCGDVLISRDIRWGVDNSYLARPSFLVRRVYTDGRDFKDDKLQSYRVHVLNSKLMKDQIRSDALKLINSNKSTLVLVDTIAHGEELSAQLGVPFANGKDKRTQEYVDSLNKGDIRGLVATDSKLGEGTDMPGVEVLIMANFTASRGPVTQCVGRGLRVTPTKTKCLILDYIPMGSTMLSRHAMNRVSFYEDMVLNPKDVKVIG